MLMVDSRISAAKAPHTHAPRSKTSARHPLRRLLFCSSMAASLSVASRAPAQQMAPLDKARMTEQMHSYFHGEKWEGPFFFGAGLLAAGGGAVLVTRKDE